MPSWDERFAAADYVYGTLPNLWLEKQAVHIAPGGRVLSLGEGEGRNAVWLAESGFAVDAVDGSKAGMAKADRLAEKRGVAIATTVADLADFVPESGAYDAVVLIFCHLPPALRPRVHAAAAAALKPGGLILLEAFTPRQFGRTSGGPGIEELLYEPESLRQDFPSIVWETLAEVEVELDEGPLHQGPASVVRGLGRKG